MCVCGVCLCGVCVGCVCGVCVCGVFVVCVCGVCLCGVCLYGVCVCGMFVWCVCLCDVYVAMRYTCLFAAMHSRVVKNIQLLNVRKREVETYSSNHDKSLSDAKGQFNRASRELTSLKAELIKLQRQKEGHTRYAAIFHLMHAITYVTCTHTHAVIDLVS